MKEIHNFLKGFSSNGKNFCLLVMGFLAQKKRLPIIVFRWCRQVKQLFHFISPAKKANEQRAALLLQKYILQISGATLPVGLVTGEGANAIYIQEDAGIPNPDGFTIETKEKIFSSGEELAKAVCMRW